jgi:hypothetical protein
MKGIFRNVEIEGNFCAGLLDVCESWGTWSKECITYSLDPAILIPASSVVERHLKLKLSISKVYHDPENATAPSRRPQQQARFIT